MSDDQESQDDSNTPTESEEELLRRKTEARVQAFLDQMESDYDSVQVMVSKAIRGENRTMSLSRGTGNVYASLAVAKEWILQSDEDSLIDRRELREAARLAEEEGEDDDE